MLLRTLTFLVIRLLTDGSILPSNNILQATDFYRASFITGHTATILTYLTDFKNICLIELKCNATNVFGQEIKNTVASCKRG